MATAAWCCGIPDGCGVIGEQPPPSQNRCRTGQSMEQNAEQVQKAAESRRTERRTAERRRRRRTQKAWPLHRSVWLCVRIWTSFRRGCDGDIVHLQTVPQIACKYWLLDSLNTDRNGVHRTRHRFAPQRPPDGGKVGYIVSARLVSRIPAPNKKLPYINTPFTYTPTHIPKFSGPI
jgi:hypothetical protein